MKNNLITGAFVMGGMLIAQNFPILACFLIYFLFGFLVDKYITTVVSSFDNSDACDNVFRFAMAISWPVSFFAISLCEFDTLKEKYNLPSFRNPFYWPEE